MGTPLSNYTSSRDNNFNLVRFVASLLVLYTHSFSLTTGLAEKEPLRTTLGMSLGDIAVDVFFVTSGFLITSSFINRGNLAAFIWARVLRIYPALIVAVLFCVFVIGLYFTTLSVGDYLANSQTYKYLFKNMILFLGVEYDLPGVFANVPWEKTVNGSLWTLPYEVRMYTILATILTVAFCFRYIKKLISFKNVLLLVGSFSVLLNIVNHFHQILPENFIRLFSMFFIGAAYYAWKEHIILDTKLFFAAIMILFSSSVSIDLYNTVYPALIPYIIFYIAYVPSGIIRQYNKFGDYSYGLYIYTFPVQQSLAALYPSISSTQMVFSSFAISLFFAIFSWHYIEKRSLAMKSSYGFLEKLLCKVGVLRRCIYVRYGTGQ